MAGLTVTIEYVTMRIDGNAVRVEPQIYEMHFDKYTVNRANQVYIEAEEMVAQVKNLIAKVDTKNM